MRTVLLTALMLALTPTVLGGSGPEAEPGCEVDQPWIGYRTTDAARAAYESQGAPGGLRLCEGEHWDGEDSISSEPGRCSATFDPQRPHANVCLGPDPNAAPGDDPTQPLGARFSASEGSLYVAANGALLARGALYADGSTVALYARDNTPGNILATLADCCSLTGPAVSEADCDQATYQAQAYEGDRRCARDNTAITLQHALLP